MDGRMFLLFKDSDRFIENKKGAVACPLPLVKMTTC